jgi:hypothetical protein
MILEKKVIEHKMCSSTFSTGLPEIFLGITRIVLIMKNIRIRVLSQSEPSYRDF